MSTAPWLSNHIREKIQQSDIVEDNGYFIYDLDALSEHLSSLQQQDVIKLWFAVKANPLSKVVSTLHQQGFNFDVASAGELQQVVNQGINPKQILNTGPAKSKKQLKLFIEQGVRIFVAESVNQLIWLNEVAKEQNVIPQVLLRVQLQWQEGEKNPLGGNSVTPFGMSTQEWEQIDLDDYPYLNVNGLHIFQWGNMLSNAKMFSLWSQMVAPLSELANKLNFELKVLDLGGGLGIDYLQAGETLSWAQVVGDLAEVKANAGVEELWLELGRFAVAEYGYYVVPVVDKKRNFDKEQIVLAGGINHLLRPAITEQPFPAAMLRESSEVIQDFDIHGPLCTSMDKLGCLPLPADVSVDDKLIFGYTGAYGFTESMPFFLCHEVAAEYVIENGKIRQIRATQSATWYLS